MDALAQTAIDFAHECLGWKDAAGTHGINTVFEHLGDGPCSALLFTDLNAVMDAVRGWIAERPLDIEIHFGNVAEGYVVLMKRFVKHGKHRAMADAFAERDDNLCHALLAACVEASRKLGAG
jgi:hypothetical protein